MRMLRHKVTIQASRYAFGLSGIIDPDEADRMQGVTLDAAGPTAQSTVDISPELETIASAQSIEELKAAGKAASDRHPQHRSAFIAAYNERKKALEEFEQAAQADAIDAEYAEVCSDDAPGV